jgi:tetratricopeptide (TPR) repeat protein
LLARFLTPNPSKMPKTRRGKRKGGPASGKWLTAGAILFAFLASPLSAPAQQGKVVLESSEQLFSVLAALNAAGYDAGIGVDTGDKAREGVRAALAKENIPILSEIKTFYEAHRISGHPGADLGQYVSLAMLLGPPPDFHFTVAQSDLPPDAKAVAGLVPLLKVFYKQADLTDLWARAQINYRTRIEQYSPLVRKSIEFTDAYLRFPAGAYLGRTYTIYVDLLGAPNQIQARIYGSNYYLVITPSKKLAIDDIRHQYLHFLLDPLAVKYAPQIHQAAALAAVAREAPALRRDFKEDFPLLVTECLIRAAELRIDKLPEAEAQKRVKQLTSSGLILVPYFYDSLADYEKQEASISVYYRQMIQNINPAGEEERLAKVKFTQPPPEVAAAPDRSEAEQLLDQGDNAIYAGKYEEARAAFQKVVEKNPQNERALFGLAVVASNTRKPDLARKYFEKTLDAARDLRLVTWSHIYLGRIDDLSGERNQALAQYRAASLTAAAYPEALRAVEAGLKIPFGAEPQSQ